MSSNLGTVKGAAVFRHIDRLFDNRTNDVAYRSQMGQTQSFVIVSALRKIHEISQMRTSGTLLLAVQQFDGLIALHQPATSTHLSPELADIEDEDVNLLVWLAVVRSTTLVLQLFVDSLTQFYHTIESHAQFWNYEDSHPLHYILTSIPARLRTLHRLIVHRILPQYPLFAAASPLTLLLSHRSSGLMGSSPVSRRRSPAIDVVPSRCSEISERPSHTRITLSKIRKILGRGFAKFKQAGRKWFHAFRTPVKFRLFVRQIFGDQVRHNCRLLKALEKQVIEQLGHSHSLLVNMLQADDGDGLCVTAKQNITELKAFLTASHFHDAVSTPIITLIHPERIQPERTKMKPATDAGQPSPPKTPPLQSSVLPGASSTNHQNPNHMAPLRLGLSLSGNAGPEGPSSGPKTQSSSNNGVGQGPGGNLTIQIGNNGMGAGLPPPFSTNVGSSTTASSPSSGAVSASASRPIATTNTSSASTSDPQQAQQPQEAFSPASSSRSPGLSPPISPAVSPLIAPPLRLRPSFSDEELDPKVAVKQLIGMVQIVHDYETEVAELIATTRPSRTRWWLHLATLGYAIYKGIRIGLAANLTKDKVKRYFRERSRYYWFTYIAEPLQGIYTTLIRDEFEMPHLGPQSWRSEMESLISMVLAYHRDHAFNSEFTETDQKRVVKELSEGDLGTINSDYEHCIKTPILAFMFGDMTRLLLIQLQHQKVNITRVYETLDDVMKLNELNFHLMAFMPAVLLVLFIMYAYATRKRISSQPVYKTIRVALWEVDRLLNRSSSSKKLDWCEQGYLVLELYKMRMVAGKIQGTELRHCFLEDLAELEDANLTTLQRLHTLQRMYRIYWFLFPVKYRT